MTAEHTNPFEPKAPSGNNPGRLNTHGVIQPGWVCRHCSNYLTATQGGGAVCDTTMGNTDA